MSEAETTTVEAPRDTSGQFTGSAEEFGIRQTEIDQGYKPWTSPSADAPPADDSPEAIYAEMKRKRGDADPNPIIKRTLIHADTGEPVDPNTSVTVEQAADANALSKSWEQRDRERTELDKFQGVVDAARAQAIADGASAEDLGLAKDDVPAQIEPATNAVTPEELAAAKAAGLEPEVFKSLQHPQVREAIETEFGRAEAVRGEYTQALQNAQTFGLAAIHAVAPELSQVPPDQMEQALQVLAQVAPDRYQAVAVTLQNVAALQQHQQQAEQHRKAVEQQQIETWAKGENARLEQMGVKFTAEKVNDVVAYAEEFGISRRQLGDAMLAHPILRSAPIQKMMADAAKLHAMQKAPAKAVPKTVPSVLRPGIARSSGERDASEISALRQKATTTGNPEDVFKLYKAKKARR